MKRTIGWLLVVLAAVFLPSALLDPSLHAASSQQEQVMGEVGDVVPHSGYRSPGDRHKIKLSNRLLAEEIQKQGGRLIADYGSYKLLEVDGETATSFQDNRSVEIKDDYNLILLNAGQIDTTELADEKKAREPDPAASATEAPAAKRLHLVQFQGPVMPEWHDELLATGVEVVSYIPNNAYLIYADRGGLRRVRALARRGQILQWEGEYKDSFKTSDEFPAEQKTSVVQLQAATDGLYAVQLIQDKEANPQTLQLIDQLKIEILVRWEILKYINVVVRMPISTVTTLSKRTDVISIQPYPMPEKFDERQNQIIAGNLTGAAPAPGDWLAYLANQGFTQAQFTASAFAVNVSDSGIDNATTLPNHFALYEGGMTANPSRAIYNRLEGTPHAGSTLQGCDGHGNINAHIIGGFIPFASGSGFPHADAAGFRFGMGVCPFVRVGSSVIFDPNLFTNPNLVNLESKAYNDGARISSNSWGANVAGAYNVNSQTFDAIVRDAQPTGSAFPSPGNQEYVVVFAAGNAGPGAQSMGAPATAKNVITAGASENVHSHSTANGGNNAGGNDGCAVADTGADSANDMIGFSSRGPCADGRKKPDLVAPGTHVTGGVFQIPSPPANGQADACFNSGGVCALPGSGTPGDPDNFFPLGQQFYTTSSGTSHSTPAIAGAAALIRQHFINQGLGPPSPAMTKATLMNSARYLTGVGANDNLWSNSQGMGAINLNSFFDVFSTPAILRDQVPADIFTATGQIRVVGGSISDPSKPSRVTIAWTDAPGPTSGNAFVNDLDLEVSVGGNTFKGNVFSGAFSATGGSADPRNNVESVFIPAGVTGTFVITIRATNIAGDGVPNFGGALDQDFALVVYNGVEAPVSVITAGAATIAAESCAPASRALDPNETVTVNLPLMNIGTGNTTNLVATLQATGGVMNPSGPQNYGVLVTGGPAVSRSFTFTVAAMCGGMVTATLQLQDGATNLGTVAFSFTVGKPNPLSVVASYSSGGMAIPIPDLGTIQPTIVVPDTGIVGDLDVRIRLNHTFDGDLDIFLVGPDGTTVELSTDNGGAGDNYGAGANDCTGIFTVFDDSAGTSITGGGAPFAGAFRPEQPLSAFNGKTVNGVWTLRISDDSGVDTGTLLCWELQISRHVFICCGVPGTPVPVPFGSAVIAESCSPPNGAPDPGELVKVSFALNNAGSGNTANLIATLQAAGGVTSPSGPQNYGIVPAGGPAVSRSFSFVAQGACGGALVATLALQDGAISLGTVSFTLKLGATVSATQTFSNAASIAIPGTGTSGPASSYPSTINVSGLTGTVSKVTVTLTNLMHTFPDDIDVLLVGPGGQGVIIMSDVGGSGDATNVTLTLDDAAVASLPDSAQLVSGTFRPTNIGTGDAFPAPAPGGAFGAALSDFNVTNPNGTWSLFINDDVGGDSGSLAGGWSIAITTAVPVCCASPCAIICPPDRVVQAPSGGSSAVITYPPPVVVGTCPTVPVCSPPSGSAFALGTTTVTCTAAGPNGAVSCSFKVTVTSIVVRDDASGVFIRFGVPPGGGATTYQFFDCRKNISFTGTGMVTISFCKIELRDPAAGSKTATHSVVVTANPCTLVGTGEIKPPGSSFIYKLNDPNISNNPLTCP